MTKYEVSEAEFDELFNIPPTVGEAIGKHVSVEEFDAMFARTPAAPSRLEKDMADFRRVGLPGDLAERAARALKAGTYGTFEETALMCVPMAGAYGSQVARIDRGVLATIVKERA